MSCRTEDRATCSPKTDLFKKKLVESRFGMDPKNEEDTVHRAADYLCSATDHFGFTTEKVYEQITDGLEQSLYFHEYKRVET